MREHLQLIIENEFLFSRFKEFKDVKYLIVMIDDDEFEEEDEMANMIANLQDITESKMKSLKSKLKVLDAKVDLSINQQTEMRNDMKDLKDMMEKLIVEKEK